MIVKLFFIATESFYQVIINTKKKTEKISSKIKLKRMLHLQTVK